MFICRQINSCVVEPLCFSNSRCHSSSVAFAVLVVFLGSSSAIFFSANRVNFLPFSPSLSMKTAELSRLRLLLFPLAVDISTIDVNCIDIGKYLPHLVKGS